VNDYQVGTLVVDMFDARTKQAIWHGIASDAEPNKTGANTKATEQAVEKMFSRFPPALAASLATGEIKNDAPRFLFSEQPATLIRIDGDPVYRSIEGTDLERIINTKPLIVRDTSGIHYLKVDGGWMETYLLSGMWSVSVGPRLGAEPTLQLSTDAIKIPRPGAGADPTIFISTTPAELIVTDGPPRFVTIKGTSLEHVENTTATVFKEPTDDEMYVLASGRWFRAWRNDGPWQFVPSGRLPADIAAVRP
jgi:hypothetical protein